MFHFSTYRPTLLKHLSYLSANFWMPDAKNDAGWMLTGSNASCWIDSVWLPGNTFLRQVLDGEYPKLVRLYSELWRRIQSLGGASIDQQLSVGGATEPADSSMTVDNTSAMLSLSLDDNDYELVFFLLS